MLIRRAGVVAVWVLTAIASVLSLALLESDEWFRALVMVLAGAVVFTLVVQLSFPEKRGFVTRLMASTIGAFAIVLVASVIASLLS